MTEPSTVGVPRQAEAEDLVAFAMSKLTRVLGTAQGTRVYGEALAASGLATLGTPDELYRFSEALAQRGGMEAAVAGLLSVAAIMRGAAGKA